ncbi:MAG: IS110 family transposase [Chloroflexota bacterium]
MRVVYERCCGLDIHKKSVVACVLITHPDGSVQRQVHTFGTMTADLCALSDWLDERVVTHVAMESTGVFWQPVYNLLEEEQRTLILVNAQHIKNVPGRKTDIRDAEWLADLLRHGLLRSSFVPSSPMRALRELTRYRKTLVQERTAEINRLQKVLESANIKLASVVSDVLGVTGRHILDALVAGETDPDTLAALARGTLRGKIPDLKRAVVGRVHPHHAMLITRILAHLDFLEESIAEVQSTVDEALSPLAEAVTLLDTIPGVSTVSASIIIAEIGTDMSRFPSAKHLASWAGLCPGNKQSGGKRLSGKTTSGNPWLRAVLGEVAWVASRSRGTYLSALYQRIARRRGKYKALVAVAHSILVSVYGILRDKRPYNDLGVDYFDKRDTTRLQHHHVQRLEQLGYSVTLTPKEAA